MDNVVKLSVAPEWVTAVDARRLDWLVAKGYLQQHQRRDWYAVETAIRNIAPLKGLWPKYLELGHEIEEFTAASIAMQRETDATISRPGLPTTSASGGC